MKLAFYELEGWEEPIIRAAFPDDEIVCSASEIDDMHLPEPSDAEIISVFVHSKITPQVLERFPHLKAIATRSTGYDHMDCALCASHQIPVMNVPGYGDATVAEYAFGLLLALTRKIYQAADQIKETGSFSLEGLRGMDLEGKTIGIIGTGRIGKHAIRIAQGFSMQVLAHDLFPDLGYAKEKGFSYVSLDELLKSSDVISLHAPLTETTTHLINAENIGKIKKGAYLINTARGGLVDTDALTTALQHGILAGAALDVLEEEGETKDELLFAKGHPKAEELKVILENHALMQMPNVLVTPHNAFNTQEALERILHTTIENIKNFESGSPQNIVS
jgi:D-lactate dehydrogenase